MYGKAPKEYLSLWSVIALGIGSMVGAGIFALMGQATLMAGKNVYWSFILGGVAALLSGYTYAKLGSRYPGSGGIMDYFNEAFSHKTLSGALTLIYLGTLVITVALVAKSFGAYASRLFLPDRAVTIYSTALFASVAILLLGALNMGGARACLLYTSFAHVGDDRAGEGVLRVGVDVHLDDAVGNGFADIGKFGTGTAMEDEGHASRFSVFGYHGFLTVPQDAGFQFDVAEMCIRDRCSIAPYEEPICRVVDCMPLHVCKGRRFQTSEDPPRRVGLCLG